MALPLSFAHLGSTGVIQNPGDLGSLGQSLQGLPQILQANMQLQMERQRQAQNEAYQQAQMSHLKMIEQQQADAATTEAQHQQATGEFIKNITQNRPGADNSAVLGFGPLAGLNPNINMSGAPMSVDEARGRVAPSDLPYVEDKAATVIKTRREEEKNRQLGAAQEKYLSGEQTLKSLIAASQTLPPNLRPDFLSGLPKDLLPQNGLLEVNKAGRFTWLRPNGSSLEMNVEARPQRPLVQIGGPGGEGLNFKDAQDLRKEFLTQIAPHLLMAKAYTKVKSASANAAGDMSLIFGYMKLLDPGSTVREGEQAQVQQATGVPDQVRNLYNRVVTGERLNTNQRAQLKAEAYK